MMLHRNKMEMRVMITPFTSGEKAQAPSLLLLGLEPLRAAYEYAGAQFADKAALPSGDGHPVVIFPGLASDARALAPLKALCSRLGYATHDWGRGFNTGPQGNVDEWLAALALEVCELLDEADAPATLIGWSLGGIYARELAKKMPGRVRQVITIGTPFAGTVDQTHAGIAYRLLNGSQAMLDAAMQRRLATPPPVPTTSIYSRSDGVVSWRACVQTGAHGAVENLEVSGSHCGLGWNSEVFAVVADRLAQPLGAWRPHPRASGAAAEGAVGGLDA
jgi:pimeloyl-ACP methyl ester carboxylesterase